MNSGAASTAMIYYVRSSAMGGQVIEERDGQRARLKGHIPAGGAAVATDYAGTGVRWQHTNPVTGDVLETDSAGAVSSKETLDPLGVNVGDSDPFAASGGGGIGGNEGGMTQDQMNQRYAQLMPGRFGGGGGAVIILDGLETNASLAVSLLAITSPSHLSANYRKAFSTANSIADHSDSVETYDGLGLVKGEASHSGIKSLIPTAPSRRLLTAIPAGAPEARLW